MKKLLSCALFCTFSLSVAAQTNKVPLELGNNELKINLFSTIMALPELTYERILEDNMSIGMSLGFGIGDDDDFSQYRFIAIPYYRLYFGQKKAAGFFVEGNASISNVRDRVYYDYTNNQNYYNENKFISNTSFGMGAAVGAKFLTKNGFTGEFYGGVGRFLGDHKVVEAYPRVGITLGKRF